jgi:diacylglycerol kinase (ATP)
VRVSLFYNEDAGDGAPLKHMRKAIERHGHQLVQVVEHESDAAHVLDQPSDVVVAAGGDGTVAAAARALAGHGVPLAVLPVGTANNIAKSLGYEGSIDDLIEKWSQARHQPLDLGVARGAWGERVFVESLGTGLIPAGIAAAEAHPPDEDVQTPVKLVHASGKYREVLSRLTPRPWTISLDGVPTTGDFLLVEVLNIPRVGPNFVFSRDANPSDGSFSVAMATEEHREQLREYVECLIEGRDDCELSLISGRATHVELQGGGDIHVDDELLRSTAVGLVSISMEAGAIEFLA